MKEKGFKSAWWLPDRHSQTLWRKIAPNRPLLQRRQRVELDDGDFIDLDWVDVKDTTGASPIVLLLHGLCGCSQSPYIKSLQKLLFTQRIESVAMNFRGCSGEMNRLARAYHSGNSDDLESVFTYLKNHYPERIFSFVGFSLGGNVLLKWLTETECLQNVRSAVAISTPFYLSGCSEAMSTGVTSLYGRYFVRRLLKDVAFKKEFFRQQGNSRQLEILNSLGELDQIKTLWQFDDKITGPLHGFDGAEDYYSKCSSGNFLDRITTPSLLIQSRNDPIVPVGTLPDPTVCSEQVKMNFIAEGGHVGFISSAEENWLEKTIYRFIDDTQERQCTVD